MTACEHLRYQAPRTIIFVCLLLVAAGIRVYAQSCAITVKPTVSGCYAVGGASKATVSVEVAWQNPPSGNIVVEYAGQSRIITPGVIQVDYGFQVGVQSQTIVSPQVVAFEVDLASTASGQTVAASFTSVSSCSAVSSGVSLPAACQPMVCAAGQLGGTVWNDFNADGVKNSGESTGIPDVTIKAYDCSGALVGTTSSDAFGKYTFTSIAPSAYPLRIEFTDLPSYIGHGTMAGADGRTTVQFVNAADCNVDLGVLNPANYCQSSPLVYVSCFVNGDPLLAGTAGGSDAVVSFPYSASGVPGLPSGYTPPDHLANASEVGSIWGNAYNKFTKKIFMSATLRRHAGLGPMGLGGIYVLDVTNPATPVVSQFVNATALGAVIDDPANPVLSNAARGLDGNKTTPSHDPSTLSQIGRAGIGDLDISADGNTLWFVSMHDKKLYSVDITAYNADGVTKPTAANTQSFAIPDPGCIGGTYRPYGLAVKDGEVFVGVVCDAGVSQNKSDMRAYVYKWDGTTWTTVFDFPLTYPKGFPDANGSIINRTGWYPWTDDWNTYTAALRTIAPNISSFVYPMPILSDIEFDIDGAMILAFADRVSLIGGNNNYSPDISNTTQLYNNTAGGDILRAFYANGTYILENAAKAGPAVGYGPVNNQGPGFGEFYNENLVYQYNGSSPLIDHAETVLGALALRPGSGEVLVTALDPLGFNTPADYSYNPFDIGGVIHANNSTGQKNSGYAVYQGRMDSGLFGKATGLGDIELACDLPDYIEIGNRVWIDSNKDGVQDPCEKALAGVNVALYQGSTLIASTTTNAAGEYYFNNKPGSSTTPGTASTTLIQANTVYSLVFGVNGQFSNNVLTAVNGKYQLTTANSAITNASDLNDSDAAISTIAGITAPVISVTTEANGSVNHTFDAGFICLTTSVASISTVKATCSGITANTDAKVLLTGIHNGDKVFLVAAGSSVPSYTATGSQPVSASAASFTGLSNPASSTGQSYSVVVYNGPCCYTVLTTVLPQQVCVCSMSATVTPTVCNSLTNQYSISGTISLTNTPGGTALITDGARSATVAVGASATSVAWSLTGLESGTGSHTVVVSLPGCGTTSAIYNAPASCSVSTACGITLKPTVSGCYDVNGVSKATVSIEVGWANAPAGQNLIVSTGGQSATITPGSFTVTYPQPTTLVIKGRQFIVTPQVVAFEIDLTGGASLSTVTAQFTGSSTCAASATYTLPAACPPVACNTGQLGGTVFRDFNADGIKQATETQGVVSISVTAYDCNGVKYGPVLTDQFGRYTFPNATITYPVRVEFSDPAGIDIETIHGSGSKTSVQFVNQATCSVDLGIANATLYCQTVPQLFVPCYVYGDPLSVTPVSASLLSANADALVTFPYDESTTNASASVAHLEVASAIGTVWGLGYNRYTKDLFMGAVAHRHAGLGPLGLGGIYVTHTGAPSVTTEPFIDVTTIGIDVGTVLANGAGGRGLSADKTQPSNDADIFPKIGKVGIGGLEISEDGKQIWLVNLHDKKLYSIDITAYNQNPANKPTGSDVKAYAIPDPGCANGESRPWALHVYGGKMYVGTICDAFTTKSKSNLRAYVYAFDMTTNTFNTTPVFDFPLTYPKGYGISPLNSAGQAGADSTGWYPWTDTFQDLVIQTSPAGNKSLVHPQPILADIDFDIDGSLVLAFADRTGLQGGWFNYSTDPNDPETKYKVNPAAGDVLRAYFSGGTYILENNGKVGPFTGQGVNNNQGPGFGEFYNDNYFDGSKYAHTELALGGLALRPGSGHVVGTTIDPVTAVANSGGVKYWNNTNGMAVAAANVYTSAGSATNNSTFGKASGLGEPELNCNLLEVIEIGNRLWVDINKDGIQDACEKALAGVKVSLYEGTTLIAATTTDAAGEYYFNSDPASATATNVASTTAIKANTTYTVRFGTDGTTNQYSSATGLLTVSGLGSFSVTTAFSTVPDANTLNDSNAQLTGNVLSASVTTGAGGSVNHTIDAGFICLTTSVASVSTVKATCSGITANSDAKVLLTGIQNGDKVFLVAAGSLVPSYTATGSQPVSASAASFTGLSNPASSTGQSYSVVVYNGPCCYTVLTTVLPQQVCVCSMSATVTPTVCNSLTNQYSISGTISLTNTPGGTALITDGARSATVAVGASATSVAWSLTGLTSGTGSHTVVITLAGCSSAVTTYSAPASCTIAPSLVLTSATICYGSSATLTASSCIGIVTWSNSTTGTTLVTPNLTQNTNYTATCTTAAGATTSVVGTVTVMPQPVLSLQASATFVTVNTPVSLSAVGCVGTVAWSTGDTGSTVSVTPVNTTQTYSATCTTGPGCLTTASITINTEPAASIGVISAMICYSSVATLTTTGCTNGTVTWSNGTTGTSLTTPVLTQNTGYTATCTTSTGSTTSSAGLVTVMPQPVLSLAASSTNVTVGTPVSISAIGCTGTVTWSTGDSGSTVSVTPVNTTQTYSATCLTGPGCLTTASITVNTQPAASLLVVSATVCYGSSATLTASGCNNGTVTWSNNTTGTSLITPNLTQTTNYTATCTTQTGSTTFAVGTATVMPQPVLSLAASSTNVTVGTPVSISAIGCTGTVTWSTGDTGSTVSVTPVNTTQAYSATCTTGPGCLTTASITVNTQPAASLVVVSATVCYGSSATLTASGCNNGTVTWSNNTTGTSLITPNLTETTNYTATCTTSAGSSTTAVGTATVVLPASLTISRTSAASSTAITVSVRGCSNGTLAWSTGAADNGKTSIVVPAAVSSQYSVTCTTGFGCRSTAQVSVGSANTNDFIVADAMICQGQSVTLTAIGCAGTLSWLGTGVSGQTTASVVVTPTQTQGYTAICTNGTNSVEVAAQVTVMATPVVTLTTGNLTVVSGSVVSLTAGGCDNGQLQWSLAGVSGTVVSATASEGANVYSVSCVVTPTCSDVKSITITGLATSPILNLDKTVSASRAQNGDVISYTVTVSNTGNAAGYSIVVNDVLSAGLTILPASVSSTAGSYSVFSNQWSVGQLNAGAVATLTYSVSISADGVLYNTATIPGDTAKVCTTVPIKVCKDSGYQIRLNAPAGYSAYQWYFKPVSGVETKVYEGAVSSYTATQAGEYRVVVNAQASCPDQSCCPIIIEEQEVPSFTVVATSPTCVAAQANTDGQLRVTGLGTNPGVYQYAISEGTSFTVTSPTLVAVPASGVVATGLAGNKSYTVRIYDALGCYRDQMVLLPDTCQCPPAVCVPITVKRVIR